MWLDVLIPCVSYAGRLARGLARWEEADDVLVVTEPDDLETRRLCAEAGVACLGTWVFRADGAAFNKAAALDAGLAVLDKVARAEVLSRRWVLLADADVEPPRGWRAVVEAGAEPGFLLGARRVQEGGGLLPGGLAGFFLAFAADDPAAQARPLLGSWYSAAGYDTELVERWPEDRRVVLPLDLVHRGEPVVDWCGVGRRAEVEAMLGRRDLCGWRAERLGARI